MCEVTMNTLQGKKRHTESSAHLLKQAAQSGFLASSYECDECGKSFLRCVYYLTQYKHLLRNSGYIVACKSLCNVVTVKVNHAYAADEFQEGVKFILYDFYSLNYLEKHLERNHNGDEAKYQCDECDKRFVVSSMLSGDFACSCWVIAVAGQIL